VGPQVLKWQSTAQFINDGAIQVGSMAAPGSILFKMHDLSLARPPASVVNTGSITLQNGSRFQNYVLLDNNDVLLNAAGAVLRGGFHNSRARRPATRSMHAVWSRA